jgi:hypothetical protein
VYISVLVRAQELGSLPLLNLLPFMVYAKYTDRRSYT